MSNLGSGEQESRRERGKQWCMLRCGHQTFQGTSKHRVEPVVI